MAKLDYLSWTGFSTFATCPRRYQNAYVRKLRPPVEDQRNVLKGNALHGLMESYLLRDDDDPNYLVEYAPLYWSRAIEEARKKGHPINWRTPRDEGESREKYLEWAFRLAQLMKKHGLTPSRIQPEFKADSYITIGPHRFKIGGRIDILLRSKAGQLVVLDLKGSERKAVMKAGQLVWYKIVVENFLKEENETVSHVGWLLPGFAKEEDRVQIFEIPDSAVASLKREIEEAITAIKADDFPLYPKDAEGKDNCYWCPVKNVCPLFGGSVGQKAGMITLGADL